MDRGAATVDALEENAQELAFAKGYNAGYKQSVEHPTGGELLHVLNKGHEQGWKEAVEKACEYLKANHEDIGIRYIRGHEVENEIEIFKKFMEGQR